MNCLPCERHIEPSFVGEDVTGTGTRVLVTGPRTRVLAACNQTMQLILDGNQEVDAHV